MPSPWTKGPALPAQAGQIDWLPVNSSNVAAIAYEEDFRRLFIRFKSGWAYAYEDVPFSVWNAFLAAPSKGKFVFDVIRGAGTDGIYAYRRFA